MEFRKIILIASFCIFSINVIAGGFQLSAQGQKQCGMGHTGTGLLSDGASMFFNPGSTIFRDTTFELNVGTSYFMPNMQYLESSPGVYSARNISKAGTPFSFYATFKPRTTKCYNKLMAKEGKLPKLFAKLLGDSMGRSRYAFGIASYTPFGSSLKWADDWKGQFIIREIGLKTIYVQPTLSIKITEYLGIGVGYSFINGDFYLRKGIPLQNQSGDYGQVVLEGKTKGAGLNVGLFVKATDKLSFGINYKQAVKLKLDAGTATFTVPDYVKHYFPDSTFTTYFRLPQIISFGVGYKVNDKLTLAFDLSYSEWSTYDTSHIDFAANTDKLKDVNSPKHFKNCYAYKFGAQYKINKSIIVRGGFYYDTTPTVDGYVGPEGPDANRIGITTGASFNIFKGLSADVSLMYIQSVKREVNSIENNFSGTYQLKIVAPGVGINYCF